ncbi:hypothetical protein K8O96_08095 [Clostridium sporogenes]|uniref:Uncharacterized protein n=2 Tax=Clostridium TaxID=1485 RepID=A0A6M0T2C5_CLOBO|nr:hypothetical protein [Clostridium sporogenes]NFA60932.1 hypothetical protein [Clostridium botulinum]MDS1005278.1 hypothetical protein [Clostridium sporogenes]NFI75447.1 hypothetical protein [Clostridium sporogenes]NFL73178.1 hypothetical protein [Clostridium sporogenes]NFM25732.1 hypothetical protein [Clostridium sporogenes]
MKKENEFLQGFKQALNILPEEHILVELDEWCFNNDDIVTNLIKHFHNEGKECSFVGLSAGRPILLLEDHRYIALLSTYHIAPGQRIMLTPEV